MDTINIRDIGPTARIPLLEDTRLAWIKGLAAGNSYYTMSLMLSELADGAVDLPRYIQCKFVPLEKPRLETDEDDVDLDVDKNDPGVSVGDIGEGKTYTTRTEKYLRWGMGAEWQRFILFLAIPRQMLESIVLGTVAWDYHPSRGARRDQYGEHSGFGIYAIGLSVSGRYGAWMTATELEVLIRNLERYMEGYDAWKDNGQAWAPGDVVLQEFVASIDSKYGLHKDKAPRFVSSTSGKEGMEDLVRSLKRRVEGSLRCDPTGTTPLIQSPLYVGLSTELRNRLLDHRIDIGGNGTLKRSNKAYGLMLSLMKYHGSDVRPRTTGVCVLRIWEKKDLWFAETLISALASSLICQDGFNRTECGDPVKSAHRPRDGDAEDYVKVESHFLYDNLQGALADLRVRQTFLSDLHRLESAVQDTDDLLDSFNDVEKEIAAIRETIGELNVKKREAQRLAEEYARVNEELAEEEEIADLLGSIDF